MEEKNMKKTLALILVCLMVLSAGRHRGARHHRP